MDAHWGRRRIKNKDQTLVANVGLVVVGHLGAKYDVQLEGGEDCSSSAIVKHDSLSESYSPLSAGLDLVVPC